MDKLYNYILHYNIHRNIWAAIPRGKEAEYFNDMTGRINTGVLYAEDVNILIDFISNSKK